MKKLLSFLILFIFSQNNLYSLIFEEVLLHPNIKSVAKIIEISSIPIFEISSQYEDGKFNQNMHFIIDGLPAGPSSFDTIFILKDANQWFDSNKYAIFYPMFHNKSNMYYGKHCDNSFESISGILHSRHLEGWHWNLFDWVDTGLVYYSPTLIDAPLYEYGNKICYHHYLVEGQQYFNISTPNLDNYKYLVFFNHVDPNLDYEAYLFEDIDLTYDGSCPSPMIIDEDFLDLIGIKKCIPNPNISEEACNNIPGTKYQSLDSFNPFFSLVQGEGCYNVEYVNDSALNAFLGASFELLSIIPPAKFSSGLQRFLLGSKSLWDSILNLFRNSPQNPKPNLTNHEIVISNIRVGSDGRLIWDSEIFPKVKSREQIEADYQAYLKKHGYINEDGFVPPVDVNLPKLPEKLSKYDDYFYKGGDSKGTDTANFVSAINANDKPIPHIDNFNSENLNSTIGLKTDLNSNAKTETNITLTKTKDKELEDLFERSYQGTISYGDGSTLRYGITTITPKPTEGPLPVSPASPGKSGAPTKYKVTQSTTIKTNTTDKQLENSYEIDVDANGNITNEITNPPVVIKPNESGGNDAVPNEPIPETETNNNKDIIKILNQMNSKLDELYRLRDISIKLNKLDELENINAEIEKINDFLKDLNKIETTNFNLNIENLDLTEFFDITDDLIETAQFMTGNTHNMRDYYSDKFNCLEIDIYDNTCSCPYQVTFDSGYFPAIDIDIDICKVTCQLYNVFYWIFYLSFLFIIIIIYYKLIVRIIK